VPRDTARENLPNFQEGLKNAAKAVEREAKAEAKRKEEAKAKRQAKAEAKKKANGVRKFPF